MNYQIIKKKVKKVWGHPLIGFVHALNALHIGQMLSDECYTKLLWRAQKGYSLDLDNPKTFNEKLQWLKLFYHKPEYTTMVDKYLAKKYVADRIGEEHVIPLLGVWDRAEDIDFSKLPNQFVLKCNHTSGLGLIICKDKSKLDIDAARQELNRGLKDNYFKRNREWPYKNVKRVILAEEYKEDESGYELKDYKLYCFGGEPKFCQVDFGKSKGVDRTDFYRNIYDIDWKFMDIQYSHPNDANTAIPKPQNWEKMKDFARILSENEPFARIDFYNIGEQVLFSEITFYPIGATGWFKPNDWDKTFGDLIKLPQRTTE